MKKKSALDATDDSRTYNILLKHYRYMRFEISCDICPYHRRGNWNRKPHRNWKQRRRTQWKTK